MHLRQRSERRAPSLYQGNGTYSNSRFSHHPGPPSPPRGNDDDATIILSSSDTRRRAHEGWNPLLDDKRAPLPVLFDTLRLAAAETTLESPAANDSTGDRNMANIKFVRPRREKSSISQEAPKKQRKHVRMERASTIESTMSRTTAVIDRSEKRIIDEPVLSLIPRGKPAAFSSLGSAVADQEEQGSGHVVARLMKERYGEDIMKRLKSFQRIDRVYDGKEFPSSMPAKERLWYVELKERLGNSNIPKVPFRCLWPSLRQTIMDQLLEAGTSMYRSVYEPALTLLRLEETALAAILEDNASIWETNEIPEHLLELKRLRPNQVIDPDTPPPREVVKAIHFLKQEHLPASLLGEWQFPLPKADLFIISAPANIATVVAPHDAGSKIQISEYDNIVVIPSHPPVSPPAPWESGSQKVQSHNMQQLAVNQASTSFAVKRTQQERLTNKIIPWKTGLRDPGHRLAEQRPRVSVDSQRSVSQSTVFSPPRSAHSILREHKQRNISSPSLSQTRHAKSSPLIGHFSVPAKIITLRSPVSLSSGSKQSFVNHQTPQPVQKRPSGAKTPPIRPHSPRLAPPIQLIAPIDHKSTENATLRPSTPKPLKHDHSSWPNQEMLRSLRQPSRALTANVSPHNGAKQATYHMHMANHQRSPSRMPFRPHVNDTVYNGHCAPASNVQQQSSHVARGNDTQSPNFGNRQASPPLQGGQVRYQAPMQRRQRGQPGPPTLMTSSQNPPISPTLSRPQDQDVALRSPVEFRQPKQQYSPPQATARRGDSQIQRHTQAKPAASPHQPTHQAMDRMSSAPHMTQSSLDNQRPSSSGFSTNNLMSPIADARSPSLRYGNPYSMGDNMSEPYFTKATSTRKPSYHDLFSPRLPHQHVHNVYPNLKQQNLTTPHQQRQQNTHTPQYTPKTVNMDPRLLREYSGQGQPSINVGPMSPSNASTHGASIPGSVNVHSVSEVTELIKENRRKRNFERFDEAGTLKSSPSGGGVERELTHSASAKRTKT